MRLCLALGYPSRRILLEDERLNSADLAEWEAFERVDGPIGFGRLDGLLRWAVGVILRIMAKSGGDFSELEPPWWRQDEDNELVELDDEATAAVVAGIAATMGGGGK